MGELQFERPDVGDIGGGQRKTHFNDRPHADVRGGEGNRTQGFAHLFVEDHLPGELVHRPFPAFHVISGHLDVGDEFPGRAVGPVQDPRVRELLAGLLEDLHALGDGLLPRRPARGGKGCVHLVMTVKDQDGRGRVGLIGRHQDLLVRNGAEPGIDRDTLGKEAGRECRKEKQGGHQAEDSHSIIISSKNTK